MKYGLSIFALIPFAVCAQDPAYTDTSDTVVPHRALMEVTVTAARTLYYSGDTKVQTISPHLINAHKGDNLGQLLQNQSPLNIKAYGVGGALSNISLRGTSTSHAQINWNGFPINSLTLGSCDLSMVPVGGFDMVTIALGATGAMYGSGTFGGAVNLENDTKLHKQLSANAYYSFSTLNSHTGGVDIKAATQKVSWSGSGWLQDSENRFDYYDYIAGQTRTQTNGQWNDKGFVQNLALKTGDKSTVDAGIWFQDKNYFIPSKIGSTTYEFQKDSAIRFFARYKQRFKSSGLVIKAASFRNHQYYWQKSSPTAPKSIESTIDGSMYAADANYRHYTTDCWVTDIGVSYTLQQADVDAYKKERSEHTTALIVASKYMRQCWSSTLSLRQETTQGYPSHLLWGLGATYSPSLKNWNVRANVASKYRNPTFNDRYWIPGGNPDLKPESGITAEGGMHYRKENNNLLLECDLSVYHSVINDMIVWRPGAGYWSPKNYQQVFSKGLEVDSKLQLTRGNWQHLTILSANLNHSLVNKTYDSSDLEGKTMSYSPRTITSLNHTSKYKVTGIEIWHKFTSDRFTTSRDLMEPFNLFGARAFTSINIQGLKLGASFAIDNLLDETYELVELYPLPGRTYQFKIQLTI